jgi:hypothetical protein
MWRIILCFLLAIVSVNSMSGNHVLGGNITVECAGDDEYDVFVTLYTDCFGALDPTETINLFFIPLEGSCLAFSSLAQLELVEEVTDICPEYLGQTSCNGGVGFGAQKVVYTIGVLSDDVALDPSCTWSVSWGGGDWNYFTNVVSDELPDAFIQTVVDPSTGCLNLPAVVSTPIPQVCVGQDIIHSLILDLPEDYSALYALAPLATGLDSDVEYDVGYSFDQPFSGLEFDPESGTFSGTAPWQFGTYGVAVEIDVYNEFDIFIATVVESFAFVVTPCPGNQVYFNWPPIANANSDIQIVAIDTLQVELGDSLCFSVEATSVGQENEIGITSNFISFFPGGEEELETGTLSTYEVCALPDDPELTEISIDFFGSDGDCEFYTDLITITVFITLPEGCTLPEACNYDPEALVDDGSCVVELCFGDIDCNNDLVLSNTDLLCFLSNYGCDWPDCTGDFNGDGVTNAFDLLIFLTYWPGLYP